MTVALEEVIVGSHAEKSVGIEMYSDRVLLGMFDTDREGISWRNKKVPFLEMLRQWEAKCKAAFVMEPGW